MIRTYAALTTLKSFDDRFRYLSVKANVGAATFGEDRYLNQAFYTSREWRDVRHYVIARDEGCDLGLPGYDINFRPTIHHMNPITKEDVLDRNPDILDPEFLITVSHVTHNAIHYGDERHLPRSFVPERRPGDTKLW